MYPGPDSAQYPDRVAVIMGASGASITYGRLEWRANQIAHLLRQRGLRRGDHIAVLMNNSLEMIEIQSAAERTGVYYTLINCHLTAGEVAYILDNCEARVFFASADVIGAAEAAAGSSRRVEARFVSGRAAGGSGWEDYESTIAGFPGTKIADEQLGAAMLYSSGTTGPPKGIVRALPDVAPSDPLPTMQRVNKLLRFRPGLTYLNPAPLYHAAPQAAVGASLRIGGTAVVMERFDAAAWCDLVERHRVTHTQLVPTMFNRLLRLPEDVKSRYDLSSLEVVVHSAAPCPQPVKKAMIDWLGPVVYEYYSATEGNGITFCDTAEWLAHPGTVGRAVVGTIEIQDEEGRLCPPGIDGTVWFRGATNFTYFKDDDKTASGRSEDGQASTVGDIGHLDTDGFLYLTDRKSHMIISGGVNIYPQETENLLTLHPAVADVAVIGVPNLDLGEEVKAVVELVDPEMAGPALEADLIAYCRSHLASLKCPRSVDFTQEMPRLPNGKLYKHLLRDQYWREHSGRLV